MCKIIDNALPGEPVDRDVFLFVPYDIPRVKYFHETRGTTDDGTKVKMQCQHPGMEWEDTPELAEGQMIEIPADAKFRMVPMEGDVEKMT